MAAHHLKLAAHGGTPPILAAQSGTAAHLNQSKMAKKIIFSIRITSFPANKPNIWYARKIGSTYQATLTTYKMNPEDEPVPVYQVSEFPFFHVYASDCEVIKQKVVYI